MNIIKAHNLTCPIDGDKLEQINRQFVCANGHSFDIARQGYINLLPVQHKRSKQPGDSKAMVVARTEFLNSGIYEKIASKLTEIVINQITTDHETCILDAGCGEGYYLDVIYKTLIDIEENKTLSFIGLDISKDAIIQSSKRNKQISWLVGTNRQPPVQDSSVDIILCLFGFMSVDAFCRVLKPGGKIILLDPGPEHLTELRKIIYPQVKKQDQSGPTQIEIEGFTLLKSEALTFKEKINSNEKINQLLVMTPHFYRASKEGRQTACSLDELDITVDVIFRVLEKS